jgi:mRNA-degrading endonuclease RelE of RelBE toxin-antitoxin system
VRYRADITESAKRVLRALDAKAQRALAEALRAAAADPYAATSALQGQPWYIRTARASGGPGSATSYRAIYRVYDGERRIVVGRIGESQPKRGRPSIYERLEDIEWET